LKTRELDGWESNAIPKKEKRLSKRWNIVTIGALLNAWKRKLNEEANQYARPAQEHQREHYGIPPYV
jgi:hypothetical protein